VGKILRFIKGGGVSRACLFLASQAAAYLYFIMSDHDLSTAGFNRPPNFRDSSDYIGKFIIFCGIHKKKKRKNTVRVNLKVNRLQNDRAKIERSCVGQTFAPRT